MEYEIKIKLEAKYNQVNIEKILERGTQKKFIYFDHIIGESYLTAPILNAHKASSKVMNALSTNKEGGPDLYTLIEDETTAHLRFYKVDEDGFLQLIIGGFNCPTKKGNYINFDYYIRLFLDICIDFPIIELRTEIL